MHYYYFYLNYSLMIIINFNSIFNNIIIIKLHNFNNYFM